MMILSWLRLVDDAYVFRPTIGMKSMNVGRRRPPQVKTVRLNL
jgi:hypothetical protein